MTIVMAGICFLLAATAAYGQEKDFYDNYWKKYESDMARRASDSLAIYHQRETLREQ